MTVARLVPMLALGLSLAACAEPNVATTHVASVAPPPGVVLSPALLLPPLPPLGAPAPGLDCPPDVVSPDCPPAPPPGTGSSLCASPHADKRTRAKPPIVARMLIA